MGLIGELIEFEHGLPELAHVVDSIRTCFGRDIVADGTLDVPVDDLEMSNVRRATDKNLPLSRVRVHLRVAVPRSRDKKRSVDLHPTLDGKAIYVNSNHTALFTAACDALVSIGGRVAMKM